jgi:outer membrane receptor for ferrienterochelin and colicins
MSPPHRAAEHPFTRSRVAALLVAWPVLAAAQTPAQLPPQRVEIRSTDDDQRRADIAGRQVVSRETLLRHGDTRLVDALQRLPGVAVESRGPTTEVKLGGLGDGYTQVLLNGEPLPRGVSLDSIALDSLERVEIVRGSTVQSSQAIAGSLNLVTRRPATQASRDLSLRAALQSGLPQVSATLNLGDAAGAAIWGIGIVLSHDDQAWPAIFVQESRNSSEGTLAQRTLTVKREHDRTDAISLNPRLAWKREDGDGGLWQIATEHSLRVGESRGGVSDRREPLLGPPPAQQASVLALNYRRIFWRGSLQALRRQADGSQTEARLNLTHASRDQQARLQGLDFTPRLVQDSAVDGRAVDQSSALQVNHRRSLGASHRLLVGAEWEQARRQEDRVQVEQSLPGGLPPDNLDERYDARARRWAAFAQDEWSPTSATDVQAGVRVERLDTASAGNVFDGVRQSHRLVGPVLRMAVRPGDGPGTVKLGLSRGFKLPAPRDVMPRRYVPIEVSPTAPAQSGNPELRPERAWSLDGSWTDRVPTLGSEVVLSAALRRIEDVILDRLIGQPEVANAPWLLQRFNGGRAWTATLELELRGQTRHALVPAAPLRWQASVALARSRLDDVAGERPALVGQAPWQVKLDLTQGLRPGWTVQAGLEARGPALADLPSGRRVQTEASHVLSASLTWQPRPRQSWSFSVTQLAASDSVDLKSVRIVGDGGIMGYQAREAWQRRPVWRVGFDSAF